MRIFIVFVAFLSACHSSSVPPIKPSPSPSPSPSSSSSPGAGEISKVFPVGVWFQPFSSFPKWKSRGINLMVGEAIETGRDGKPLYTHDQWHQALVSNGLKSIRKPVGDLVTDAKDPNLTAWMMSDEPDLNYQNGNQASSPESINSLYLSYKRVAPSLPVFINFSGGNLKNAWFKWGGALTLDSYKKYVASADLLSFDLYPLAGWNRPDWLDYTLPIPDWNENNIKTRMNQGFWADQLETWSNHKSLFVAIELGDQKLPQVPPGSVATPAQVRGEIWHSIIHGAQGIFYFADCIGTGWCGWDQTTPALEAEIIKQNAALQANAGMLLTVNNLLPMDPKFPTFEAAVHNYAGKQFKIVLNMSGTPQKYSDGSTYGAWEYRILTQ